MGAYTVGEIRVNTAGPIKMIQNLYFENKGNAHVNLVLEAFIFEDDVEKALFHVNDIYNDDYTFYDSNKLNQLEKITGYTP